MARDVSFLTESERAQVEYAMFNCSGPVLEGEDLAAEERAVAVESLELMRAHFESHPTMPGEKDFKNRVNELLDNPELIETMTDEEKDSLARRYAETEVRETKIIGNPVVSMYKDPIQDESGKLVKQYKEPEENAFQLTQISEGQTEKGVPVQVYMLDVELRKVKDGVNVYAKKTPDAARFTKIGSVPENFLTNNPMNVSRCPARICIEDYSNGKLRNVSERLVVESSRMSGDYVELNNDMLNGLDKESGLEQ